jgi:hypothetical protein
MIRFLRLRPPLRIESSLPANEVLRRLQASLRGSEARITGTFSGNFVVLRIGESRQHFGSPQLSFEVESRNPGSSLTGLFMPMPSIWTAFMALYGLIVFGGFCGGVYGFSQLQIDHPPHALWAVPAALFLLLLVYAAACVGQCLGQEQMEELRQFVEQSLAVEA